MAQVDQISRAVATDSAIDLLHMPPSYALYGRFSGEEQENVDG
jgi:hypothetical protein